MAQITNDEKLSIFKDMEELIWKIFEDGSIGIPMTDSGFVDENGFTLGSTSEGKLDGNYTIHYNINGECDDDFEDIGDMDDGQLYMDLYQKFIDLKITEMDTNAKLKTTETDQFEYTVGVFTGLNFDHEMDAFTFNNEMAAVKKAKELVEIAYDKQITCIVVTKHDAEWENEEQVYDWYFDRESDIEEKASAEDDNKPKAVDDVKQWFDNVILPQFTPNSGPSWNWVLDLAEDKYGVHFVPNQNMTLHDTLYKLYNKSWKQLKERREENENLKRLKEEEDEKLTETDQ
jgi:hypothetical protein